MYYVSRAVKRRLAGKYDEAMLLLTKAKEQFGLREDIELEMAHVYEELEYDDEAIRSYLRIVRMRGEHRAQAFFQLALYSVKRGELKRAVSYYQEFCLVGKESEISPEAVGILEAQLLEQINPKRSLGRQARAKALEQRAVEHMHAGKTAAAVRSMQHAVALMPTARGYTLLACCCLLRGRADAAIEAARSALKLKPGRIQTRCILIDALYASGAWREAHNALYVLALKARNPDDLLALAIESAKHGEDSLTLRATERILRVRPFHARAIMLRGCALINMGKMKEASRLFGRMSALLPEDTVCQAYYRMARSGDRPDHRLDLGMDVDWRESHRRTMELLEHSTAMQCGKCFDSQAERDLCRICAWAIESSLVGAQVKTAAIILLAGMKTDAAREVLQDCLMDAQMDDQFKMSVLKILTVKEGFKPYWVNLDGNIVRLAAGGVSSTQPAGNGASGQRIVQLASDALIREYSQAPQALVSVYLKYAEKYPEPKKKEEAACAAAFIYAYYRVSGRRITLKRIAREYGQSGRRCARYVRRILPMMIDNNRERKSKAEVIHDELH